MKDERGELISMAEALRILKCSGTNAARILRRHLDKATGVSLGGRLEGVLVTPRCWLVYRHTAEAAAQSMHWNAGLPKGSRKPGRSRRRRAS